MPPITFFLNYCNRKLMKSLNKILDYKIFALTPEKFLSNAVQVLVIKLPKQLNKSSTPHLKTLSKSSF